MREVFYLSESGETVLWKNNSIGMLFSWLIEHRYFQENPGSALVLTEEHTPKFMFDVTEKTASRDAINAWNKYNQYI